MTLPPASRTLFWRISCWGAAGCSCSSNLIRAMGPPFLLEPTDPSTSIITISAQRFWKGFIHGSAWKWNSPKLISLGSPLRPQRLLPSLLVDTSPYFPDEFFGGVRHKQAREATG